ncbi:Z1 domain-containing protein [Kitasatospora sp. NPDC052896]|uniref:Z1 domain-containing protein n=1 Tax=Kitasatospora sp. NPDC052896 TaxID=3364061 RepID=UPI0037C659EB
MSNASDETLDMAMRVALAMLPVDRQATPDEVAVAINAVLGMLTVQGKNPDRHKLTRMLEELVAVFQESSSGLEDRTGHKPWLPDAKNERDWDFWERYRRYLEDVRRMPPRVVWRLDQSTDEILGQLEDPRRHGAWRRTGLAIGQVQSGKTGHYIGLAAKAADAGYRLVVILAGIHNDLRSQTQLRVDEGLLGFDTQYQLRSDQEGAKYRIGVGAMSHAKRLDIASLTNSAEKGDFDRRAASKSNIPVGNFPVVLVIKKHRRIIDYLRTWVTEVHGTVNPESDRKIVQDVPLFVIDDEADNASINVSKDPDNDPSKINAAIRELLSSFDKSSYVGYTATPFANIYIDPDADHDKIGADLFPDSFVRSLRAPSNYLGPERVFGLQVDDQDEEDIEALPLVRHVEDHSSWVPNGHKSSYVPSNNLPASLREAIDSFLLACAARRARGQVNEHNSMLVHVTRFTAVQGLVRDQVDDHLRLTADRLRDRYGRAAAGRMAELQDLWERDFVKTTGHFPADDVTAVSWSDVAAHLQPALAKIQVKAINGAARDALEYYDHRKTGLSVIAIGGEKLSRGLTLEGLTVSYYLRPSKTYDALLQMGRWFGYRPGYEDLCRLYTTPSLERAYVEITAATDELRRDIEEMAALGLTPREFGLKVRASSLGLGVTAANKMRQGTKVLLSYSGEAPETVIFNLDEQVVLNNFRTLETFVRRLDATTPASVEAPGDSCVWRDVSPEEIVTGFFDSYVTDRGAQRVRPAFIAEYIRRCAAVGELGNWTVRLVGRDKAVAEDLVDIAGHKVGMVTRAATNSPAAEGRYTIRRVLSPRDESRDLDADQWEVALAATRKAAEGKLDRKGQPQSPTFPTNVPLRTQRRMDQALLLIYPVVPPTTDDAEVRTPLVGFAVSFPFSADPGKTEYVVNNIWLQEDIETEDDEEIDA